VRRLAPFHCQSTVAVPCRRSTIELRGASLHPVVIVATQPKVTLQEKHAGHTTGCAVHVPATQRSPMVQALPSLQALSSGWSVPTH
jgi:hypothetical protein